MKKKKEIKEEKDLYFGNNKENEETRHGISAVLKFIKLSLYIFFSWNDLTLFCSNYLSIV